jgi:hypothetical protein
MYICIYVWVYVCLVSDYIVSEVMISSSSNSRVVIALFKLSQVHICMYVYVLNPLLYYVYETPCVYLIPPLQSLLERGAKTKAAGSEAHPLHHQVCGFNTDVYHR